MGRSDRRGPVEHGEGRGDFWHDAERRAATRQRFEERMAIPILVAAALLTAVSLVLLFVELSRDARITLLVVDGVIWLFFAIEYAIRLTLATEKRRFVREEWLDLVLVVLPLFQPMRLLGALVRLARLSAAVERTAQSAQVLVGRHKLYLALGWATGLVLIASIVTPLVEPASSKIKNFGDGVWWAIVTTTTVGYGDLVPESTVGRIIGLLLMLAGIGIIGLLTANIASLFLEPAPTDDETGDVEPTSDRQATTGISIDAVEARLDDIDRKLQQIVERLEQR